ncbi:MULTISPECIES: hypothetical protein [Pseudomonas]|uniref:Uncharacterized protein n=1 Tax=Pseudomonas wuhanensis TaxID=2954098 RepID=A0ABY9GLW6_9PSED|nr:MULTISPECIES: hypothetical protein [unclassified Pseudomonas]WLI10781.1 hypothetical protein PSH65_21725 [Pseudomonas sp. FP603]WLI16603.1 hypothetical protein PSH88_20355 [Pseudomonas sp. FP607]
MTIFVEGQADTVKRPRCAITLLTRLPENKVLSGGGRAYVGSVPLRPKPLELFHAKAHEFKSLFNNTLDPERASELRDKMLAAGIPL